jgi:hypothetical protein
MLVSLRTIAAVQAALDELPTRCPEHGKRLIRENGGLRRTPCCDNGRPALARNRAEQHLQVLRANLDDGERLP